ncbi:FtsX-like permease family protein [Blochmannia endosymbiont of Camponotus (Colobopsis) obliquus]|uniref:FtsX-like permease family protein n=1 Tax=Blochmannia endosymbiont of Camponotus (Colobopsis) obliquus TaxID=1505597 RepID=UPI00061A6888|nr:FtsX-like permease family protein [Blochmannia endosymbiont of Camponotus (Colobopsis) obliquus]AKC60555.1 Lipoprotein-releasing system transmembrane protein LolC [Blochmannia endosymbiont of Camponotus (Colobopsis) obliquus]
MNTRIHQPIIFYIALRYIFRPLTQQFSSFLFWSSTVMTAIGVMSLIVVLSVMNGFENELEKNVLQFIPHVLITNTEKKVNIGKAPLSIFNLFKDCTCITSLTISDVILNTVNNISIGVMLGINPNDFEPLGSYLMDDTSINELIGGEYRVILGKQLAEQLGVQKGDTIRLIVPSVSDVTPIGLIFSQRLFKISGIYDANSEVNTYQILVHQQDAARLMHYPDGYATGWRLFFKHPLIVHSFKQRHLLSNDLIWEDWRVHKGSIFQAMCFEKNMMSLLLSLIIMVAIFNVVVSLSILVIEKKIDIAILQTQGLKSYQIILIFIIYGLSAVILGSMLGIFLGLFLVNYLNWIIFNLHCISLYDIQIPVLVKPLQIFFIVMCSMILSFIIIIYPSYRAVLTYPTQILRHAK